MPRSWIEADIGDICSLYNGRAFKKSEWSEIGLPIIRIQNLNKKNAPFNHFSGELDKRHLVSSGNLLFAWSGTPGTSFGAHEWRGKEAALNQHIFKIDFNEKCVSKPFFKYAINHKLQELIGGAQGGVGLRHVTKKTFESTKIHFPPIEEQIRIAQKLDQLLAQVDTLRARVDAIPAILKKFRQSVLSAAVSGRLLNSIGKYKTVDVGRPWPHSVEGLNYWKEYKFSDVVNIIGGSQPPKSNFSQEKKVGYIRLIQIRDYKSDSHIVYIPKIKAKRFCSKGDVMIGRYGPPIFQILRGLDGAYNVALMKAEPSSKNLDLEYLFWFLKSSKIQNYIESGSDRTAGQSGVNKKFLESYPILLPPIEEQKEIVNRVEHDFALADKIEAKVAVAQQQINHLTQSILAKAFRGELVPQDPNDEPASELLQRIKAEREAQSKSKAKTPKKRAK